MNDPIPCQYSCARFRSNSARRPQFPTRFRIEKPFRCWIWANSKEQTMEESRWRRWWWWRSDGRSRNRFVFIFIQRQSDTQTHAPMREAIKSEIRIYLNEIKKLQIPLNTLSMELAGKLGEMTRVSFVRKSMQIELRTKWMPSIDSIRFEINTVGRLMLMAKVKLANEFDTIWCNWIVRNTCIVRRMKCNKMIHARRSLAIIQLE